MTRVYAVAWNQIVFQTTRHRNRDRWTFGPRLVPLDGGRPFERSELGTRASLRVTVADNPQRVCHRSDQGNLVRMFIIISRKIKLKLNPCRGYRRSEAG